MRGDDGDLGRILTFVEIVLVSFAAFRLLHLLDGFSQVYPEIAAGPLRIPSQWLEWPGLVALFFVAVGVDRVLRPCVSRRPPSVGSETRDETERDTRPDRNA